MVGSIGMRRGFINRGDWSDGLERQGSNPWPTTKIYKENQNGAVTVLLFIIGMLVWLDRNFK